MAITNGFPPVNTISPSVRITEQDLSLILPQQSFHRAGIIGFASKGPINVPTLIATQNQLTTTFGYPHPESGDPYLIYAASQYLLVASEAWIVRVADTDNVSDEQAQYASVEVPSAGGQIVITGSVTDSFVFANDSFFRWRLNGNLASKTLIVLAGTYTTDELMDDLNSQLAPDIDGIEFYNDNGSLEVRTIFAYGPSASLELVSALNAIYGGPLTTTDPNNPATQVVGMGTGMTRAKTVGANAQYPVAYASPGQYQLPTGPLTINIVLDGTDVNSIDNVVQTIDLTSLGGTSQTISQLVTAINNQKVVNSGTLPGGWTAYASTNNLAFRTDHFGEDARMLIKPDSTMSGIFGFDNFTKTGTSPTGTSGTIGIATYGIVDGAANGSPPPTTFTVTSDSPGIDGNSTQVVITNNISQGNFSIQVLNNGAPVENWGQLTKDETSSYYVEAFIAEVSDWIRVNDNTSNGGPPLNGTYSLSGGSDGIPSDPDQQDVLLVGDQVSYTGMYALSDPEQIDIDLLFVPGHPSTAVVMSMLNMCQNVREDCIAIVDPPFGLTVQEIIAWQNGVHPLNTTRFDSDFGALYWPWLKVFDTFNLINVWVPPSGSVSAVYAQSDNLAAPWYAPAGLKRGLVPNITDVFSRPTLIDRDQMYGYSNCVNTIIEFNDVQGFYVWGQKTLQRTPTSLDRVNVRRLMFYIEKSIRTAARSLLFEPNDATLQQQFVTMATGILNEVQVGRGITQFQVQCDATLNTPDVVDSNELRAIVGVVPTRAAEFIFITFAIFRTGGLPDTLVTAGSS